MPGILKQNHEELKIGAKKCKLHLIHISKWLMFKWKNVGFCASPIHFIYY